MITRYKAADPLDPTSQAEYKVLAAGAQRYWHGTRAAFEQVKNSIPNNTMICITDDNDAPSDNAPIGSVFDYEGNAAPDGYLFCDGSTFDTSLYPDLYLFLGSDTLPVRGSQYDYSNAQAIAISAFASGYTVPADGLILIPYFQCNSNVSGFKNAYINGVIVASPYSDGYSSRNVCVQTPVKKGDVITIDSDTSVMSTPSFVPVTKYKLIKATSNMSKSDASALLAQVIQHMTPDYAHQKTITGNTWTADEDVWITYTTLGAASMTAAPLTVDSVTVSVADGYTSGQTYSFHGRVAKGSEISCRFLQSPNICRVFPFK